jgi:DNA-binding transcriptional regulator YdaS (Cro superfamily)
MTLADYLTAQNMTVTAFAQAMGREISTVHGWVSGARRPRWADVPAIERATNGAVTASDFVPREPAPQPEQAA